MLQPIVSIIIPLYNAERYIAEAIESILKQSYTNWELIIVNDGSTDNSLTIAKQFESERVFVYDQPNRGQCTANNFGYSKAKGEYIKFFDADDILSEEFLEAQIQILRGSVDAIASASWGRFYNDNLSTFKLSKEQCWRNMHPIEWLHSSWRNAQPMMQCALWLIPRKVIEKSGLWNEQLSLINDFEFFTRVILASSGIKFCNNAVLFYRSGMNSKALSGKKSSTHIKSAYLSIKLATNHLLERDDSTLSKLCCANVWQSFIYEFYYLYPMYAKQAIIKVKNLGGSDLPFPAGGITKLMSSTFGWKLTNRIKLILKKS